MALEDFLEPVVTSTIKARNIKDKDGVLIVSGSAGWDVLMSWAKTVYISCKSYCKGRCWMRDTYTEIMDSNVTMLPREKPVHTITSMRYLGQTDPIDADNYSLDNDIIITESLANNRMTEVIYDGGLDTLDETEILFGAIQKQLIAWYNIKDVFGKKSYIGQFGSSVQADKIDLLPIVKFELDLYLEKEAY